MKNKIERINRIIARGEVSDHCHVVIGNEVKITRSSKGEIIIKVGGEDAVLRHIIESLWIDSGIEKWTEEHKDIKLSRGKYAFIQQTEYDPYLKIVKPIID